MRATWNGLSNEQRLVLLRDLKPQADYPRAVIRELVARNWEALPRWAKRGLKKK